MAAWNSSSMGEDVSLGTHTRGHPPHTHAQIFKKKYSIELEVNLDYLRLSKYTE